MVLTEVLTVESDRCPQLDRIVTTSFQLLQSSHSSSMTFEHLVTQSSEIMTAASLQPSSIHGLNLPDSPLFGTDGIRGKVGDVLTANLALQVGYWAGQILRQAAPELGPIVDRSRFA